MIKVRFAPSPTGYLHFGTARGGLYNWLFARKTGAAFVLRIEDTDKERSKKEYEENIVEGLKNLGIEWDEFYRQSERTEIYREYLKRIVDSDKAYPCFCSKDELEAKRQEAEKKGGIYRYDGKCAGLSKSEADARVVSGERFVIRLRVPQEEVSFTDLIRGEIKFDAALLDDIVIAKGMDEPLYNFSVVVDDALMNITHVIRGEDHISNTPKQILIFRALGFKVPEYAHLPMILTTERKKMSKRDGKTNLFDFFEEGYLPEALRNFTALLGWHPKGDNEIFPTAEELIKEFELERVQKGGAVFDIDKLNWLNRHYIGNILSPEDLTERAKKFVPAEWNLTPAIIASVRSRLDKLGDIKEAVSFYFEFPDYPKEDLSWKGTDTAKANLEKIYETLSAVPDSGFAGSADSAVMAIIPEDKKGEYLWPLRVALSGRRVSPGPFEIIACLGKAETLKRIEIAVQKLD